MVVERRAAAWHPDRDSRELEVSRSTISRDITAIICTPRESRPKDPDGLLAYVDRAVGRPWAGLLRNRPIG